MILTTSSWRALPTLAAALLLVPLVATSATASGTLDAHFDTGEGNAPWVLCADEFAQAQTFVAESSGTLDQVDVYVGGGPVEVAVYTTDPVSGAPLAQLGSGGNLPAAPLGWAGLAVQADVVAGTTYAVVMSPGPAEECITVMGQVVDPYPNGMGWKPANPGFTSLPTTDFFFRTYVSPDTTYSVSPFSQPIDNDVPNIANAGRALPFKFRVTDQDGGPVTDLTGADVSVAANLSPCNGTSGDVVESYAAGSGLTNLGDGYYEYAFKTSKAWAGTCGTLTLTTPQTGSRAVGVAFK